MQFEMAYLHIKTIGMLVVVACYWQNAML